MVMNKRDLHRAFSPGKNVRRVAKRRSLNRRSIDRPFNANIKVVVRVRPISNESGSNSRSVVSVVDDKMLVFDPKENQDDFYFQGMRQKCRDMTKKSNKEMKFAFDKVFDTDATNNEVFEGSTKEIIGHLIDGYNCSVFVYGATGAGKTYTMLGTQENPGITYLTMLELYEQMEHLKNERKFEIAVSYMEVYNETVKDLISPGQDQLHVREDDTYGVKVQGLSVQRPNDAAHLLSLLEGGNRNRSQHPTDANAESSRSHAVFQVYIKMTSKCLEHGGGEGSVIKVVKLSMIDLAGSERGSATGYKGSRFAEGANINKSLLSLGNCINALADGLKHIPYRNSKLTRLLKDSLGGNCKTVMIANISPSPTSYEDTYNTLKYADRAKKIKLRTKKNVVAVDMHVTELASLVEELRRENEELRRENAEQKRRLAELEAAGGGGGGGQEKPIESTDNKLPTVTTEIQSNGNSFPLVDENENEGATETFNSTFVAHPVVEPVKQIEICDRTKENKILERISQIYKEREEFQKKLLQLEAESRILSWKSTTKRNGFLRLQSLCGNQSKEYEKYESKLQIMEENTALRVSHISEQKKLVWTQLHDNGCKALQLLKEASPNILPKLELISMGLKVKGWHCMADHSIRIGLLAEKERCHSDKILEKISSTLHYYHSLLSGHGLITQSLEKQYSALVHTVEGMKGVSWQDQLQKEKPQSSVSDGCEKIDNPTNSNLNETFCLSSEEEKDVIFNQIVTLPIDKIIEHGLCEPEVPSGLDGEISAVTDGIAKVELFSSLAPTSILSSVLPFAPLTYRFAAPTSNLPKNSTSVPRSSHMPKCWNRTQGKNYGLPQRSFREKSREDKENTNTEEKMLQPSRNKSLVTSTPPASNGGSARKILHPKKRSMLGTAHPYPYPAKTRVPLEPRISMASNCLMYVPPKSKLPRSSKSPVHPSIISSKVGELSTFGK